MSKKEIVFERREDYKKYQLSLYKKHSSPSPSYNGQQVRNICKGFRYRYVEGTERRMGLARLLDPEWPLPKYLYTTGQYANKRWPPGIINFWDSDYKEQVTGDKFESIPDWRKIEKHMQLVCTEFCTWNNAQKKKPYIVSWKSGKTFGHIDIIVSYEPKDPKKLKIKKCIEVKNHSLYKECQVMTSASQFQAMIDCDLFSWKEGKQSAFYCLCNVVKEKPERKKATFVLTAIVPCKLYD